MLDRPVVRAASGRPGRGPAGPAPLLRQLRRLPAGYLVPSLVVLALLGILPLIDLVTMAFSDVGPTNLVGVWEWTGTENLRAVFDDPGFWQAVRATALFTAVLLVIDLTVGFLGALALTTGTRAAKVTIRVMVFVWALPPLVSGSVWKFLLAGDGAVNAVLGAVGLDPVTWLSSPRLALWSVSLVAAWASIPFAVLIIHGGLLDLPQDVIEAARIDGASLWQLVRRVIVPILAPTLTILVVLIVLYGFRSFDFVFVMTEGGPGTATTTLPYLAYRTAFRTYDFGVGSAVALLSMAAVVLLAVPYVRRSRDEEAGT